MEPAMDNPQHAVLADPFAMLIHPEAVLSAIERSSRLGALASRVCRPLDKPLIPKREGDEQRNFDESVETLYEPTIFDEPPSPV
jgi:hypothetical protein